jgi:hypothetical protein
VYRSTEAAAGVVERGHAHLVDLGLVLDAELVLGLDLGGQAVVSQPKRRSTWRPRMVW